MDILKIREDNADFVNESLRAVSPNNSAKATIMSILAHNKQFVNENYEASTGNNIKGVGPVTMGGDPGTLDQFHTQAPGSADIATLLGMTMSIFATTVAFDLVPIVPVTSDLIQLEYTDIVYSGGRFNSSEKPKIFTIESAAIFADNNIAKGDTILIAGVDGDPAMNVRFISKHRTEADKIIVSYLNSGTFTLAGAVYTANEALTLNAIAAAATRYSLDAGATVTATTISIELTSAANNDTPLAGNDLDFTDNPMERADSEQGNSVTVEFQTYKKSVSTKSYEFIGKISRAQARQFRSKGLDGVPMLRKNLQSLASQAINDLILGRMRKLGVTNHYNLFKAQGVNLNLYVDVPANANKALTAFGVPAFVDMNNVDRTAAFGNIINSESNSSAENLHTRHKRVESRIHAAAGLIGHVSRHGAADAAVLGPQLFAAIKNSAGFTAAKFDGTITQDVKNLYYAGDLAGVKIFANPKLRYNDTSIMVGRTNKTADGLDYEDLKESIVFCPQDLAATVELISEQTASPKIFLESIFALAEVGINPSLAYLTFAVNTGFSGGTWI